VVVILLGLTLLWSPRVAFSSSDEVGHTRFRVRREKFVVVPRAVSGLIVAAGVMVLLLARERR